MDYATRSIRTCVKGALAGHLPRWIGPAALGLCLSVPCTQASELAQPATHYAACTGAALAGFPWTHAAFGKSIPGIALRNMTLVPCRIAGFPSVRAYESTGRPARVRVERQFFADNKVYAYTVGPGSAVFFALYGEPPRGEFDRSCIGINQIDVELPGDARPIDVTVASGTCGGRLTLSQIFPVAELAR